MKESNLLHMRNLSHNRNVFMPLIFLKSFSLRLCEYTLSNWRDINKFRFMQSFIAYKVKMSEPRFFRVRVRFDFLKLDRTRPKRKETRNYKNFHVSRVEFVKSSARHR